LEIFKRFWDLGKIQEIKDRVRREIFEENWEKGERARERVFKKNNRDFWSIKKNHKTIEEYVQK